MGSSRASWPGPSTRQRSGRGHGRRLPERVEPAIELPRRGGTTGSRTPHAARARSPASRLSSRPTRRSPDSRESPAAAQPGRPLMSPTSAELEATRDELVERLREVAQAAEQRRRPPAAPRAPGSSEMVEDPAAHKWEKVSSEEMGEPGCATYEVRPAVGPRWRADELVAVKVSGGCPLAGPLRRHAVRREA